MISTVVLAAEYAGTIDVRDTSTVAVRANQPAPIVANRGQVVLALDVSTLPEARIRLHDRRWEYTASYSPTLTAPDLELDLTPQTLHAASVGVGWHDQFARVTLSESAFYGTVNTAYLNALPAATQPTAGQPSTSKTTSVGIAGTATCQGGSTCAIDYGSSDTHGSVGVTLGRRAALSLTGGYIVSGGLSTLAQSVLPKQYGPRAAALFTRAISPRDGLDTVASAQEIFTSGSCVPPLPVTQFCHERSAVFEAYETFRHQLSPAASVSLSAGGAASYVQLPREELIIEPAALAIFARRFGEQGKTNLNLSAQFGPVIDFRTGFPGERLQTTASLSEEYAPRSTVRFTAGWLQSVPVPARDPNPLTVVSAAIETRTALDRRLDLGVGAVEFWQNQTGYGTLETTICYVSLSARAPTVRF